MLNAQGDVVQLRNQNNAVVANYQYDAWGKLLYVYDNAGTEITDANHIAHLNPFRYRGYYYDAETGFYATGTRYYDPFIGRFLNADDADLLKNDAESILHYNLFTYCRNNPVNLADYTGESPANIVGGIVGGVAGAALGYLLADQLGLTGWKKLALVSAATVGGAALGAFLGPYVAKLGGKIASMAKTTTKVAVKYKKFKENANTVHHLFNKSSHKLGSLLKKFGSERKAYDAIYNATFNQVKRNGITGVFETIVKVDGKDVYVRGNIIDGIVRIGTAFIK